MPRSRSPRTPDQVGKLFLKVAAIGALNTANARKPLSRDERASALEFFPGWLTSELPLHAVAWQAAATIAFARRGALRSKAGWLGLGLSAASWATLVKIYR